MSALPEYSDRHPACRRIPHPSAYALIGEEVGLVVTPERLVWQAIEMVHSVRKRACYEKRCSFFEAGVVAREKEEGR